MRNQWLHALVEIKINHAMIFLPTSSKRNQWRQTLVKSKIEHAMIQGSPQWS